VPRPLDDAPPRVVELAQRGRFLTGEPFFARGRPVTVQRSSDARPGRLALLRARPKGGRFMIDRVLGRPDVARDVLEALMLDRGLARRFPPGVERAAQEAAAGGRLAGDDRAASAEPVSPTLPDDPRRDLTGLATFTIDPVTARDFDDAISCEQLADDAWRVWVHIADVSAYVRPGTAIDRAAYQRATSVYVPGLVEPMLPEALSNDACSLRPGVERMAVTAELELNGAETVKASFYRSVIRSDERLDYERVDRIFAAEERAEDPWAQPLVAARAAAAALQRRRAEGHALAIESAEPEFRFDRRGHITASEATEQTEAHRLIEHLMIAANEAVARLLAERGVPALHRVHERPDPARAERLVAQLASLGVATPPVHETMSPSEAAVVIAECSQLVDQHVRRTGHGRAALTSLVLRSLKQARYDPQPLGHAGLGLAHYCHFTSPIRRYPDLVCHRALLSAVGGAEDAPRADILGEAGEWTSGRERDAMVIERDADDVARCFLLEREMYEHGWDTVHDGEIVGLIGAGAFVAFGDGYEGMLPVRRMPGDWWELNEEGTILMGTRRGGAIRLGDPVTVAVRSVDAPRGRVDLDLVGNPD
jgi:ribonuclease R